MTKLQRKAKKMIITKFNIVSSKEAVLIWKWVLWTTGNVLFLDIGGSYMCIFLRTVKLYIYGFNPHPFLLYFSLFF